MAQESGQYSVRCESVTDLNKIIRIEIKTGKHFYGYF